jgi:UDP-4-amino-4,6-dideoxy-N-acetyl-beta-L-altrosamine N-acetyltransferase
MNPIRLEKYGVVLDRLAERDLEMVRNWRNSPEISRFMVYREHITPEMQAKWFASLDPQRDFHFVIRFEGIPCGLSDLKKINVADRTCVGGIFMAPEFWNTDVPLRATFCASDFAFFDYGLETMLSSVLKTNTRAIRFNLGLGYRIVNNAADEALTYDIRLEKADYDRTTRHLREYLAKVSARSKD